ncbi:trace amine-associated receptor 4-like [Dendronephthya gigantea]|uniref:trace amine-associated receptor 4-like n=1 Tax=Dendronephthya gigantea TaxID=151771 RepID=UPI00106DC17A|nr:trace amine-associated receptor 4-like [Dendronephthya gigantea]
MVWMDTFAFTISISTLTFISFDRYLKIAKPFRYRSQMTTATSLKVIFIIAFIAIALSTFSATSYSGSSGFIVTDSMMCPADRNKENIFYVCLSVGAFFVPSTVILVMYVSIFLVARKRREMLRNGVLGQTFHNQNMRISTIRQDLKVIQMLFIVVGMFIFCWGPFFIWAMLESFYPIFADNDNNSLNYWYRMEILIATIHTLPFFNSVINPGKITLDTECILRP